MLKLCLACVAATVFGAGCASTRINANFDAQVRILNEDYNSMKAKVRRNWAGVRAQAERYIASLDKNRILVEDAPPHAPVVRVDQRMALVMKREHCLELEPAISTGASTPGLVDRCVRQYIEAYFKQLGETYHFAPVRLVLETWLNQGMGFDVEAALAGAHNRGIPAEAARARRECDEGLKRDLAQIDRQRRAAVANVEIERERALEANRRATLMAVAAGLQAAGAAMENQSNRSQYANQSQATSQYRRPNALRPLMEGCYSDFQCGGLHMTCVKDNYSVTGRCVKRVNSYGNPVFKTPDPKSVYVKTPSASDCKFDTDCPAMFRCDTTSGSCFRR